MKIHALDDFIIQKDEEWVHKEVFNEVRACMEASSLPFPHCLTGELADKLAAVYLVKAMRIADHNNRDVLGWLEEVIEINRAVEAASDNKEHRNKMH